MMGIEGFPTEEAAEALNQIINNKMKQNDPTYNADRWGIVKKHKTQNTWVLIINNDERNPLQALNASEKLARKHFNYWDYYDKPTPTSKEPDD